LKIYPRRVSIRDFTSVSFFTSNFISRKTPINKSCPSALDSAQEDDSIAKNEQDTDIFWTDDDVTKHTEILITFTQNHKWEVNSLNDLMIAACGLQHDNKEHKCVCIDIFQEKQFRQFCFDMNVGKQATKKLVILTKNMLRELLHVWKLKYENIRGKCFCTFVLSHMKSLEV